MNSQGIGTRSPILAGFDRLLPDLEVLYRHIHANPELSMLKTRTAAVAAERLNKAGFEVTTPRGENRCRRAAAQWRGPTVMIRADMDALLVEEAMEAVVEAGDPSLLVPGARSRRTPYPERKTAQRLMMAAMQVALDRRAVE